MKTTFAITLLSIFAALTLIIILFLLYSIFKTSDFNKIMHHEQNKTKSPKNRDAIKEKAKILATEIAINDSKENGIEYKEPTKEEIEALEIELINKEIAGNLSKLMMFAADQGNNVLINKIEALTTKNPEEFNVNNIQEIVDSLYDIDQEINREVNSINSIIYEARQSPTIIKSKRIKEIESLIRKHNVRCEELQEKFTKEASAFFTTEEYIRSEYVFYRSNFQVLQNTIKSNKTKLSAVYDRINTKVENILSKGKILSNSLDNGDTKLANKYLLQYINLVVEISSIVEKSIALSTYLNFTIPSLADEIVKLYKTFETESPDQLDFLNFQNRLQELATSVINVRKKYSDLMLLEAEQDVKKCLSLAHNLKRKIIYESDSRKIIIDSDVKLQISITNFFDLIEGAQKKYKELYLQKKSVDSFSELQSLSKKLDSDKEEILFLIEEYNKRLKDKSSPFSGKMLQLKMLCLNIHNSNEVLNKFVKLIFKTKMDEIKVKFHLSSSENLLGQLVIQTTEKNIQIGSANNKMINKLRDVILDINDDINSNGLSLNNQKRAQQLVTGTVDIYRTISAEINTATILRNIISYFSPDRANKKDLHAVLTEAERYYMESNYYQALNNIIIFLEYRKEKNV